MKGNMQILLLPSLVFLLSLGSVATSKAAAQTAPDTSMTDLREANKLLARAMAARNEQSRTKLHRQVTAKVRDLTLRHASKPAVVADLLEFEIKSLSRLGDNAAIEQVIKRQHDIMRTIKAPQEFDSWLDGTVAKHRRTGAFRLALSHLRNAVSAASPSLKTGQRQVLIGDVLAQSFYPNGPYDEAIAQYAQVVTRYRESHVDIYEDARMREAKYRWLNGQRDLAEQMFLQLEHTSQNETIVESAEHFTMLFELRQERLRQYRSPKTNPK